MKADVVLFVALSTATGLIRRLWKQGNDEVWMEAELCSRRLCQVVNPPHHGFTAMSLLLGGIKVWMVANNVVKLVPLFFMVIQRVGVHSTTIG